MRRAFCCFAAIAVLMGPGCLALADSQVSDPIVPVDEIFVPQEPEDEPDLDVPGEVFPEFEEIPADFEDEVVEEVTPAPPPREVKAWCLLTEKVVEAGTPITLQSELLNFLPSDIVEYQWQCKPPDGEWTDVAGANMPTFTYVVDETNFRYAWRVVVYCTETE